jgi:hypothetical protein
MEEERGMAGIEDDEEDGGLLFSFNPVEGVSLTIKNTGGGAVGGYDAEWCDLRVPSDAEESRYATQPAFSESTSHFKGLFDLLQRIVFGERPGGSKALALAQSSRSACGGVSPPGGGETVLHLQKRHSPAEVQRVFIKTNIAGELIEATWTKGAPAVQRDSSPAQLFFSLAALCTPDEEGWALVRPAKWSELPAELWWNVLRRLTKCEGAAVSCTCNNIRSIVALDTFIWAPEAPPPQAPPPTAPAPDSLSVLHCLFLSFFSILLFFSLSMFHFLSVSVSVALSTSVYDSFCRSLVLARARARALSLSLSRSLSLSLSRSLYLSLSLSLSLFLSFSFPLCLSISLSLSLSRSLPLSVALFLYLSCSLCLYVFFRSLLLSPSLCVSEEEFWSGRGAEHKEGTGDPPRKGGPQGATARDRVGNNLK